ncbi:uncharacterized protein LOC117480070 isoform X1 [Trematomus bernacchii]|uniref:uncharacterized protein LOC117469552 isoform X1 n=2 Tax=Trematomus bernacchii TaxID=40690 RepID=UPI00146DFB28|nr:uncharacterized protein LOC117469552 isoform X1 [Trematomus bernacchii]XP_033983125.1 uncharacterized protein LOC117480070 isoform X1 [Trematomus bernacchii]
MRRQLLLRSRASNRQVCQGCQRATNRMLSHKIFQTLKDFEEALADVEETTITKYIVYKKEQVFGENNVQPSPGKKIYWQLKCVPYDGVPFQLVGTKIYGCHQGKDRCTRQKEKYHAQKEKQALEDHVFNARRHLVQNTKKMDCPAQITVSQVMKCPGFKIAENSKAKRRELSAALKAVVAADPSTVEVVMEYHTCFTPESDHQNHPTVGEVAELREPMDSRVEQQIVKLTLAGARKLSEIRRQLFNFVNDELFRGEQPPPQTRRRFYPTDKDIRNILSRTKEGIRESKNDQVNLQLLTPRWLVDDCKIKYRPSQLQEDGTVTKLLFCYQTAWQRRLLHLYGQQMCLLDATYRTCRYSVPLFFLCVRTNVCYAVVGLFVTQSETTADVKEALQVFKEWNPDWSPSHFMVDFSEVEIGALEEEFQGSKVLLCDFHREKAWVEWCRKKDHGVSHAQDSLLPLLRSIAAASTPEEFSTRLCNLQEAKVWKDNEKVRAWFSNKWLPEAKRWVHVFRDEDLKVAIYTNNGVERQNETLKHSHLEGYKNCSLSEMLTVLVTDFLPRTYRKYIELNVKYSSFYRRYNENMPKFLKDRPRSVADHVMSRLTEAQFYEANDIVAKGNGMFHVKSQSHPCTQHHINFGESIIMPSCTCKDWAKHKLPCKHFCAVFNHVHEWGWEKLASNYRDNPLFSLDNACLGQTSCERDDSGRSDITDHTYTPVSVEMQSPCNALPERKRPRKVKQRRECASLLREITDLTYHLQDEDYLKTLTDQMTEILEDVKLHTPHDQSLPLTFTPKKRKKEMANLPVKTVPQKHPFTKRVGCFAEAMRLNFRVSMNVEGVEKGPDVSTKK